MEEEVERATADVNDFKDVHETINHEGVGSKDSIYKTIIEQDIPLTKKVDEVVKYIYEHDRVFFYFSDQGKEIWIIREYPEMKNKRKVIIKKVNELYKQNIKN